MSRKVSCFKGLSQQFDLPIKKKMDICTIMYTSGTTGDPKGAMISNEGVLSFISGVNHHLESIKEELSEDVYLSYLPLAHIFDRVIEELLISRGASIGFWHKVCKLRNMSKGYKHVEAAPICDKIIFNKVKTGLGGNLRLILYGAAPLSSTVETFLRVVTCARVLQGYGLTETCAGSLVAQPDVLAMIGTVGPPLPIVGYYKCEDLTDEVMVDGCSTLGDIGEWQLDGSMRIVDRKKNIFKLSRENMLQ